MPLYEYQCQACGRRLERIQKFSDPPLETCPHCGGKLEKLISSPAIQFKGSGWYITDYARKSTGPESKGTKESKDTKESKESKDSKETTSTSETKTAPPSTKKD